MVDVLEAMSSMARASPGARGKVAAYDEMMYCQKVLPEVMEVGGQGSGQDADSDCGAMPPMQVG